MDIACGSSGEVVSTTSDSAAAKQLALGIAKEHPASHVADKNRLRRKTLAVRKVSKSFGRECDDKWRDGQGGQAYQRDLPSHIDHAGITASELMLEVRGACSAFDACIDEKIWNNGMKPPAR